MSANAATARPTGREDAGASRRHRLDAATRLLKAGRLPEAEILIADLLNETPGDVDALLLSALLALARGEAAAAFTLLAELATQVPQRADVIGNLGVAHLALGRAEEALFCLEQAVQLAPRDTVRRAELARLLLMRDRPRARTEILRLQQLANESGEAEAIAEGWSAAGALLMLEGRTAAAEEALRRALQLRPDSGDDLALLAHVLALAGRVEEALPLAERSYAAAPANHERVLGLAACLFDLGRVAEAERLVRRVTATAPAHRAAQNALARILILRGEVTAGLAVFAPAVRRAGTDAGALLDMARLLRLAGDLDQARVFVEEAQRLAPEAGDVRMMRAHLLAALGRFDMLWPLPAHPPAGEVVALSVPDDMAADEALLLARFARRLAPAGGRIPCHAEPALHPLLEGVAGLALRTGPAPASARPLAALPELLGVTPADLAAPAYLAVEQGRLARWGRALADLPSPRIGIVWDAAPSGVTLAALTGALAGAGTLVSLVFDARRTQLADRPNIVDAGAHFADARDLSALVAHLDLVCGADGLALHMAGAMGRPALVLVPAARSWTWAHAHGRSLWYPSVRVLQQARPGDWSAVLDDLGRALRERPAEMEAAT